MFILLVPCIGHIGAQDSSRFVLIFNPIGVRLNASTWEEFGLGYFNINNNYTNSISLLGLYKWSVSKSISFNSGLGLRQQKYNFDYLLTDPFDGEIVTDKVNRYYNRTYVAPHFGLSWASKRVAISLGYEFPFELYSNGNIETYYGPISLFVDFESQDIDYYEVIERHAFIDDVFRLATPVFMCDYKLSDKIAINVTTLIKPYGNFYLYQLSIRGEAGPFENGSFQLNDALINNHNISIFLGIEYSFD